MAFFEKKNSHQSISIFPTAVTTYKLRYFNVLKFPLDNMMLDKTAC